MENVDKIFNDINNPNELLEFINDCNDIVQIRTYLQNNEDKFSGDYTKDQFIEDLKKYV